MFKDTLKRAGSAIGTTLSNLAAQAAELDRLADELYLAGLDRKLNYMEEEDRRVLLAVQTLLRRREEA